MCNSPGLHHHTERVSNPDAGTGGGRSKEAKAADTIDTFWGQGSEVYTQPLLAYIRYTCMHSSQL